MELLKPPRTPGIGFGRPVCHIMMGSYIAFRFEPRFGLGAAVAIFHDVLVTATAMVLMDMEFDLPIVAAFLTVIGYSVNDTVVVCDRIRENMRKMRRDTMARLSIVAVNKIAAERTIITSRYDLRWYFLEPCFS